MRFTPEQIQFLKENVEGRSFPELLRLFNLHFMSQISIRQLRQACYRRGFLNGIPPWWSNYKPIGTEKIISHKGRQYVLVKTGRNTWQEKQRVVWEKANGKVPENHCVIFADGNGLNLKLNNLMLVSRAEFGVMKLFGLIGNSREITAAGNAVAKVKIAIGKRKRERA